MIKRCDWVGKNQLAEDYHDHDWGVPVHDDQRLFECMTLEGAQAGLSWQTILTKRENYRLAFDNFEVQKIITYDESKIHQLVQNRGIVRHKLKIQSVITNAKAFISIQEEKGSFDRYIWSFVKYQPIVNYWKNASEIPTKTKISEIMSKALKKRGFKFIGPTICYAYMQAIGMVNDHSIDCFKHPLN